jgi:hypothetical protein
VHLLDVLGAPVVGDPLPRLPAVWPELEEGTARRVVALQTAWEGVRMAAPPWVAVIREAMAEEAVSTVMGRMVVLALTKAYPDG